jgi:DNA (cytosine-5)-methyltransferase 1
MIMQKRLKFYEFFAGGGMVRSALGGKWTCTFANDFDGMKALAYQENWGLGGELFVDDIAKIKTSQLGGQADLAWASFPCQDLSLAGNGAGLSGSRSGTFFPFWRLMQSLAAEGRQPKIVALENVLGALTSNNGVDFATICAAFHELEYRVGAVIVDAKDFLPQSRQRVFFVGVSRDISVSKTVLMEPHEIENVTMPLSNAFQKLSVKLKSNWLWWKIKPPPVRKQNLRDILESHPADVEWNSAVVNQKLLDQMSDANLQKIEVVKNLDQLTVGTLYKRTRVENGVRKVRAEVRFDGTAGCLRTPNGGSSRQTLVVVGAGEFKSRLLSKRETARLMGLPESYKLPKRYNDAYHLTGDGVAVPVVAHLSKSIFEPLLSGHTTSQSEQSLELVIGY